MPSRSRLLPFRRPLALAALTAIALLGAVPGRAAARASMLSVQSGHSLILQMRGLSRVSVGDGRIAGVVPIGNSELVINGKAPGHTTVFVWAAGNRSAYEVTVTEQQVDDIARMIRSSIPFPNVEVDSFNRSVVVRGSVADGAQLQTINDILARFDKYASEQKYIVVNAVTVAHPIGDVQRAFASIPGVGDIRVDPDGKGNVIVSGNVANAVTAAAVLERAKGLAGPYLAADGKLIDRISLQTRSQIDIKLYVLEVDKTSLKNLGVQLQSATFTGGNTYQLGGPNYPVVEEPRPDGKALTAGAFFRTVTLAPTLNALIQEGHARILSSPNLVTVPGSNAQFLVGGEIPIPFANGPGTIAVTYKDFGVKLDVTPVILGDGSIDAKMNPEVSDLDFQDAVVAGGFTLPALKTSRLSTEVITRPGESIVMAGLLRRVQQRTVLKVPGLGDLPILGQLFRSTRYQNDQSDVVFVMTPEIVTR